MAFQDTFIFVGALFVFALVPALFLSGKTLRDSIANERTAPAAAPRMAAGRTEEQKLGMMRDITQALVKNLGVDADAVVIQINEAPLHHKMKGGKSFVERAAAAKK